MGEEKFEFEVGDEEVEVEESTEEGGKEGGRRFFNFRGILIISLG